MNARLLTALFAVMLIISAANVTLSVANWARLNSQQAHLATEAHHTRKVQIAGGPPAVCLREALAAVAPLLEKVPSVRKPLEAYVHLQEHRYPGVKCPDPR